MFTCNYIWNDGSILLYFHLGHQVAFYAYLGANLQISSLSTGKTVVYNRVDLNVGNGYNVKNGVFTAPEAGLYVFNAGMFKLVRTLLKYCELGTSTTAIFLSNDHSLYAPIITRMNVLLDFICMAPADLPGARRKRKNAKWKKSCSHWDSNPQSSDLKSDTLTTELIRLRC